MIKPFIVILIACLLILGYGCSAGESDAVQEAEDAAAKISIVTTIYPLADIAAHLGGEKADTYYLLPAGASPHTYEPTVEQAWKIDEADLIIFIGAGLDQWVLRLAETSGSNPILLDLSEKVDLLESASYRRLENEIDDGHGHDDHGHDHDYDHHNEDDHRDHDHGPADPHFWLDPLIVRDVICPAISEQLSILASGEADYFKQRLEGYQQELTLLHGGIETAVNDFSRRQFISFHSAWQYFARRYNLQEVAVLAEFPGQEPSAGWLAELVELIDHKNIGAILAEPQFPAALAERLAEESGSEVLIIDPLGGEGIPGRDAYIDLMRYNLSVFRQALEQP